MYNDSVTECSRHLTFFIHATLMQEQSRVTHSCVQSTLPISSPYSLLSRYIENKQDRPEMLVGAPLLGGTCMGVKLRRGLSHLQLAAK